MYKLLSRILAIAAIVEATSGSSEASEAYLAQLVDVNLLLARHYHPVAVAASASQIEMLMDVVPVVLVRASSETSLAAIQKGLAEIRCFHNVTDRVGASCAVIFNTFRDSTAIGRDSDILLYSLSPGWRNYDLSRMLDGMTAFYCWIEGRSPIEVGETLSGLCADNFPRYTPLARGAGATHLLRGTVDDLISIHLRGRMLEVLVAAKRYELVNGAWPHDIGGLTPSFLDSRIDADTHIRLQVNEEFFKVDLGMENKCISVLLHFVK